MQSKKIFISLAIINFIILLLVYYLIQQFVCQRNIYFSIKTKNSQLANSALTLTSLLSKSAGKLEFTEDNNDFSVKQVFFYDYLKKQHKINIINNQLIWQLSNYYSLFNNKKLLLNNINIVNFRFLSQDSSGRIKAIELENLSKNKINHTKIAAIQVGMVIQIANKFSSKNNYSKYSLFNDQVKFFDQAARKVVYATIISNLT